MKADIIFYGGSVHTVDERNSIKEAVAIKGDRILTVGTKEDVERFCDEDTQKFDLKGRSLIPGIIDSHLHMAVFGINELAIDCRSPGVSSIEDIKELIRKKVEITPKGQWIRGWGYDHSKLKEKRHPNKWDLDEVAPDHPVILTRVCAHISTHNSMSLDKAHITDGDKPPAGGEFEIIDGKISGVMFENAHMDMLKTSLPSYDELMKAMDVAGKKLASQGITSVHDSGGYGAIQMKTVQDAVSAKKIKQRMNMMIFSFVDNVDFVNDYLKIGVHSGFGNEKFRLGPIKIMIDGSSSGPTAATFEPYESDPKSRGIMSMDIKTIDDIVMRAHKAGWQITCHAVGDRAISSILDAIDKAQKAYPQNDMRHRVEHAAMMNGKLMKKMKDLNVTPILQPIFLYEFGDGYMVNYGKDRAYNMFPANRFLKNGITPVGSSDCPITFSDPFLNMYMATTRKTQSGQIINDAECITIEEALRMFTINGAYISFEEDIKGSIEKGKLADLVVLSESLTKISPDILKDVKAELTMIGGEIVYQKEE